MGSIEPERAARLDLLAECTASAFDAANKQLVKRLKLTPPMLKEIDAWATDRNMGRWDAVHELLAHALKMNPVAAERLPEYVRFGSKADIRQDPRTSPTALHPDPIQRRMAVVGG
jgi:hypothetical protein